MSENQVADTRKTQQTLVDELATTAIATTSRRPLLMERMAEQYGLEPAALKSVLLKTVFPQDKPITLEMLAMFCVVAHNYKLNPLLRELYAFPSKTGGIIPIVGVDGWIRLVQNQPTYDGEDPFEYEWTDAKGEFHHTTTTPPPGTRLSSVTATLYRKDRSRPTRRTAQMAESYRDTPMWKQMPIRMLEHRAFVLAGRYAFGLGGLYDQDDADRILEGELKTSPSGNLVGTIKQPQRVSATTASVPVTAVIASEEKAEDVPRIIDAEIVTTDPEPAEQPPAVPVNDAADVEYEDAEEDGASKVYFTTEDVLGATTEPTEEPVAEAPAVLAGVFEDKPEPPKENAVENKKPGTIGPGRARRIYAILNKNKVHSEDELKSEILASLKIEHLRDLPEKFEADIIDWAEGKKK